MFCQKNVCMLRKLKGKEKISAWETVRHLFEFYLRAFQCHLWQCFPYRLPDILHRMPLTRQRSLICLKIKQQM